MDINEITIEDIRAQRPDLYEEISNEAIQASQVVSDEEVEELVKPLIDDLKEVINKRYGLDNSREITQKEIAKKLGISRSYVSRIEKRALTKMLREFIKNKNNN